MFSPVSKALTRFSSPSEGLCIYMHSFFFYGVLGEGVHGSGMVFIQGTLCPISKAD